MLKKTVAGLLIAMMLLSFAGCGKDLDDKNNPAGSSPAPSLALQPDMQDGQFLVTSESFRSEYNALIDSNIYAPMAAFTSVPVEGFTSHTANLTKDIFVWIMQRNGSTYIDSVTLVCTSKERVAQSELGAYTATLIKWCDPAYASAGTPGLFEGLKMGSQIVGTSETFIYNNILYSFRVEEDESIFSIQPALQ